jgi:hypothetical protein
MDAPLNSVVYPQRRIVLPEVAEPFESGDNRGRTNCILQLVWHGSTASVWQLNATLADDGTARLFWIDAAEWRQVIALAPASGDYSLQIARYVLQYIPPRPPAPASAPDGIYALTSQEVALSAWAATIYEALPAESWNNLCERYGPLGAVSDEERAAIYARMRAKRPQILSYLQGMGLEDDVEREVERQRRAPVLQRYLQTVSQAEPLPTARRGIRVVSTAATLEAFKSPPPRSRRRTRPSRQAFYSLVERITSTFVPHPSTSAVRIAPRFTPCEPLAREAGFKRRQMPARISRGLIRFAWWSAPGSGSTWGIKAFTLPSAVSVYWIETDFGDEDADDKRHIIATGGPETNDEAFAQLFFASNGADFNVDACCGSPPLEIASNLPYGDSLVDLFTKAFTAADSLRWLTDYRPHDRVLNPDDPRAARELVQRYLSAVVLR